MTRIVGYLTAVFLGFLWISPDVAAQHAGDHSRHMTEMNERGDVVMGFKQSKTTHHFRLLPDGGAIEVNANDPKDTHSRDQIRQHLAHISKAFSDGDFTASTEVHKDEPPGTKQMKELRGAIKYRYENMESGGRVKIKTADLKAMDAIHEFLRFQIREHETGDSLSAGSK